jgi:formylglycine-generating enzyme required for sulfatase activity
MCTVLYDDVGLPSYMRIIPAMTADTLMSGMPTTLHPAFLKNGVKIPELFIGMFQAYVIGGRAYSLPYKSPAVNVDFDAARGYCTAKGTGWHLMTNWEWAAVALWCMKNGFEPRGNTDRGRAHDATYETGTRQDGETYAPGDSSGVSNILCGTGPYAWRHDGTPAGISDLVGNVWEWVEGLKIVDGVVYMPNDNNYTLAEASWVNQNFTMSSADPWSTLDNTGASDLLKMALVVPDGVSPQGLLYVRTTDELLPIRGGDRASSSNAGLAALFLDYVRSLSASYIGFRPAFSNI